MVSGVGRLAPPSLAHVAHDAGVEGRAGARYGAPSRILQDAPAVAEVQSKVRAGEGGVPVGLDGVHVELSEAIGDQRRRHVELDYHVCTEQEDRVC